MSNDEKRLKRGLKDISPLFGGIEKEASGAISQGHGKIQTVSIFCPHDKTLNFTLNESIATQMKTMGFNCSLLYIKDERAAKNQAASLKPADSKVQTRVLTLKQFEETCRMSQPLGEGGVASKSILFFDFDYDHPLHVNKMIPMIDKWVLFVNAEAESLTEGFKFIKTAKMLHPAAEFFIAYCGPESTQKAATFYERFSELISRRLGVTVTWIGSRNDLGVYELSLEAISAYPIHDSAEKRALAGWALPQGRLSE